MRTNRLATTTLTPAVLAGAASAQRLERAARLRFSLTAVVAVLVAGASAALRLSPSLGAWLGGSLFAGGLGLALFAPEQRAIAPLGPVLSAAGAGLLAASTAAPTAVAAVAFGATLVLGELLAAALPSRLRLGGTLLSALAAVTATLYLPLGLPFGPVAGFAGAAAAALVLAQAELGMGAVARRHGPDQAWAGCATLWCELVRMALLALLRAEGQELTESTKELT